VRGDDTRQAVAFHDATKYYSLSDTESGDERIGIGEPTTPTEAIWQKDWDIKPFLYKVYETVPPIELTRDLPDTGLPALEAIAATGAEAPASHVVPDRALLGRLGLLTNGSLDRTWTTRDGRVHHYRTAGGTGAQYHLELYFVCGDLTDLDAGVYHYSAIDHSLRLLRAGDFRDALVDATGDEPSIAAAPVVMAMTSTFWRNAWRYRERARRSRTSSRSLRPRTSRPSSCSPTPTRSSTRCSASTGCASPQWHSSRSATPTPDRRPRRRCTRSISPRGGCRRRR
jgi:hypothetical protein